MTDFPTPYEGYEAEVLPAWIDSNDHMNLAYYLVLFDNATDFIYQRFGIDRSYKAATGCGTFAAEAHTLYERELLLGERVRLSTLVLGADAKRIHLAHSLYRIADGQRAAVSEVVLLHVDLGLRKTVPWPDQVRGRMAEAAAAHAAVPRPAWVGRRVSMTSSKTE